MSNVSSSAILLIIAVIVAGIVGMFAFFMFHSSESASTAVYGKQVEVNQSMDEFSLVGLEDKTYTGSGVIRELKMLYGKEQLEINIIFKDGSPSIVLTTSVLSDPSAFQEAYQNARDKIVPDDIYTASIIRNSNKIISKIEFSQQ